MKAPLAALETVKEQVERIKAGLIEAINNMPDNPKINRLGNNCFTLQFKDLGESWSPEYHDFKWQYRKLGEIIERQDLRNISSVLMGIIKSMSFREKNGTVKFNPALIDHLKKLLEV